MQDKYNDHHGPWIIYICTLPDPRSFSLVPTFKWLKIKYNIIVLIYISLLYWIFPGFSLSHSFSNETLKSCQKGCFCRWKMHLSNFTTFGDVVQCFSRKTLIFFQHLLRGEIIIHLKKNYYSFWFRVLFHFINIPRKTILKIL